MRRGTLRIDPFVRNLLIVGVVAAGVTAIGRTSERVLSGLYLVASLALIVGLIALAYRVWKENRGTFSLMSTRLRLALYGVRGRARDRDCDLIAVGPRSVHVDPVLRADRWPRVRDLARVGRIASLLLLN